MQPLPRTPPVSLVIAALLFWGSPAQAAEWRQFRGPNGSGIAETGNLPVEFGPEDKVVWKTPVPPGHSSPVLTSSRIFLTASEDERLFTICLDRRTGKILWRREAPRPRRENFHKTHGPASPTPVTDGDNVYVFFGDFGLLSYGPDGNERWRMPLGPFKNINGHGTSPILAGGMLILVCDQDAGSFMIALDPGNGIVRWEVDRLDVPRGYATPGVFHPRNGKPQLIVPGAFVIISYDLATGEKLWWVNRMAWQLKSAPVMTEDTIFINAWESGGGTMLPPFSEYLASYDANGDKLLSPSEHPNPKRREPRSWTELDLDDDGFVNQREWKLWRMRRANENSLVAIRPGNARGDITDSHVLWRYRKSLPNTPSPLLYDGVLYLAKDGGIVTSLDPETGAVFKQARIREAIDRYWASPVAGDGKMYLTSEACQVTVLKPDRQWEVLAVNVVGELCLATPAIAGGRIYLRTSDTLYCFGTASEH